MWSFSFIKYTQNGGGAFANILTGCSLKKSSVTFIISTEMGKKGEKKETYQLYVPHLIPQKINHSSFFCVWLSTSCLVLILCTFLQGQLMLPEALWEEKCPVPSAGRCRMDLCNLCWLCRSVREPAAVCSALLGAREQGSWIWFWIMLK